MSSITKICSVEECLLPHKSKGLCNKHRSALWYKNNRSRLLKGTYGLNVKHWGRYFSEYSTWSHMKRRCYNEKDSRYHRYGGRGITICDSWLDKKDGFENFILDVDWRPSPKHTLDRIDNDGNYEPGNVRWTLSYIQAANRGRSRIGASGYKGVSKKGKKWQVYITVERQIYWLGVFDTPEEAAIEYDKASIFFRPGYAVTNIL